MTFYFRYGRRPVLICMHLLMGSASLASLLVPESWGSSAVIAFVTLAKFGCAAAYAVVILVVRNKNN